MRDKLSGVSMPPSMKVVKTWASTLWPIMVENQSFIKYTCGPRHTMKSPEKWKFKNTEQGNQTSSGWPHIGRVGHLNSQNVDLVSTEERTTERFPNHSGIRRPGWTETVRDDFQTSNPYCASTVMDYCQTQVFRLIEKKKPAYLQSSYQFMIFGKIFVIWYECCSEIKDKIYFRYFPGVPDQYWSTQYLESRRKYMSYTLTK